MSLIREKVGATVKVCPHYETGLMQVEGKPDLSGLNSGSTRPYTIWVDASSENLNSLGYFKTAKANDNTCACCQIISILRALEKRSWCTRTKRAIFDPVSTHLNPHTYVGWLNPGSTRFRKKWVEC